MSSIRVDEAPALAGRDPGPMSSRRRLSLRLTSWRSRGGVSAILFALPALAIFGMFSWFPIVRGVVMSFQQTNFVSDPTWVGVKNFSYVLGDPLLSTAVGNSVAFTGLALVLGFPLPLALAVFIGEIRSKRAVYSALAYLPVVIPPVASILLWKTFYDPSNSGLFNSLLAIVGLGPFPWLSSSSSALVSILFEATWASAGTAVIVYIAALSTVRSELYEAAELDGAGIRQRIWHVTLPQLRSIILIMLLLQIIGTLQLFTEPFVFTDGGPNNATLTVLLLIYRYAFVDVNYGAATALTVLLAIALAVISVVYQTLTRRWSER